ncbi:hypothetical protein WA026_013702 [Henosepilachna vigintioctopunctata]|uniref:RanBD1 domain-containing protein n=1 Tax=Henosepilachna vigintioctopunctata TaxID=420089 RepID=A0AAW1UYB8_9CUCU
MFKSKVEVDQHVKNCLKKISSENERNNKSYNFAKLYYNDALNKLYYNVGAYEETKCYVNAYLSVKPKSAEGHYLLGLTLEKLGKRDAAIEAYKMSLQHNPKQNNLVLKVCELLADDDSNLDVVGAKYFCELAENIDPNNPSIYNLKEKLILNKERNPDEVIKLLLKELESRPTDMNIRIRLLRNFVQNNKIHEAYKHIHDIEERNLPSFSNSSTWYETVADVLIRYKRQSPQGNLNDQFWCLFISVLDKVMRHKLDENGDNVKESSDYIAHLFLFDQSLYEVSESIEDWPDRLLSSEFVNHYRAQLFFHIAVTIFKQAKKDLIQFKEAVSITLPLLFAAYHSKPVDIRGTWINHLQETQRQLVCRWHQEASFRCSQAGHTLLAASIERKSTLIAKATQHSSGMWQEHLFKKVFVVREQQLKMNTSYFVSNNVHVNLKLPDKLELLSFDEESFHMIPYYLHHYVWVSLNNHLADLKYLPFQGLQYSVKNLGNCGAETLSQLDVQAFVYCATICAQAHLKSLKHKMFYNVDRPNVLPEAVTGQLVSVEQAKFLMAAYRMYKHERDFKCGDIRMILIRGIETVRCVGRHGLDVALLVKLASIFAEKANKCTKTSEIEFNDARAELYWKTALPLLEKMKNNQAVIYSSGRIFEYKTKEMPLTEICKQIDNGKLYLGILAMKRKEDEKALNIFEDLKDPYASFYQAQIYKRIAERQMDQNKESVTAEMRSQNIILLSKARDCFYLTLDRLREPSVDKGHLLNVELAPEIEKIERLLSRVDSDGDNRNEFESISDENASLGDSIDHYTSANYTNQFSNIYNSPYTSRNQTRIEQSTPLRVNTSRKEARPSPERLDAQIRQIVATKDAAMKQVLEQNKTMVESHRCLVEELRSFKDAVYNLSSQVDDLKTMKSGLDELKGVKKSVDELKKSVDELQSFRNVADMVYELKREIVDIRKDRGKHHHQTCDDLYVLDDDYPEYNVSGNANFGQNYPTRIPPPAVPPPAAMYPHLYPNIYGSMPQYCYPHLGLSQSGLSFGAEQQFPPDLRGLVNPLASNPLYHTQPLVQPPTIPPSMGLTAPCINPPLVPNQTSTQANIFRDTRQAPPVISTCATSFVSTVVTNTKSAPVNVVITSSDPLPTPQSTSQPVLSVTIPPQHIKGNINKSQPHNYQIPLPTTTASSPPSILSKPPPALTLESMLSHIGTPLFSAMPEKTATSKSLGLQIEKSLEETFSTSAVNLIGDAKELKDRGSGLFKLIESKIENKYKIVMKQDSGKIIANHYIVEDMKIESKDNAFYWNTVDYSEGYQSQETMCLEFKNVNDAKRFRETLEKLRGKVKGLEIKSQSELKIEKPETSFSETPNTFGGFIFTSSPVFKPKEEDLHKVKTEALVEKKVESPFASFTFGSANKSGISNNLSLLSNISSTPPKVGIFSPETSKNADVSLAEEFVPTAEFQPVIPLPDIIEVKTGEEGAEELFNSRAKLLRFDSEKKEWKERV